MMSVNNYFRAVRLSLKYRWNIVGILVSSFMVAVLWGANIGSVYPFMRVVLDGGSISGMLSTQADNIESSQLVPSSVDQKDSWLAAGGTRLAKRLRQLASVSPSEPFPSLIWVVVFLFSGTLIKCLFLAVSMILVERLAQLATLDLRNQFFRHTMKMELSAFGDGRTSDLMSRFTNDIGAVKDGITVLFGKSIREPLKMAVCLTAAALISWQLLLFSLVVTPLAFLAMYMLAKSIKRANQRAMEEMAHVYRRLAESFSGIKLVKAYTMERVERSRFLRTAKELYRKSIKIAVYSSLTRSNSEIFGVTVICLALIGSGWLVLSGQTLLFGIPMSSQPLEIIPVMLFYGFLVGVSDPARKLTDVFNQIQRAAAAADRVYTMLDRVPSLVDPKHPQKMPHGPCSIEFDQVSFGYEPGTPILHNISFQIKPGETIALVGPNGCGKSTLASLLLRFYDPDGGAIRIGGVDLRDVRRRDLRRSAGLVLQTTVLFDETVADNIRYGTPHASDAEVVVAAKRAQAHEFIESRLADGYHTVVGERGDCLSGGQRQRIALARAILRDPSLVILDEATSQVDPKSEQAIHDALREFLRNRTAVIITHRTTTLEFCERIVVMEDGCVADIGTHKELIGRSVFYQRMVNGELRRSA
jgi:ATP-binding cassette subfamily B protein/subfamily B ATP-binding cassette protein MsbA